MEIQNRIERKLTDALAPTHLEIVNESDQHNVPPGSESHFKVVAVSEQFAGKRAVARHQQVYGVLKEEMAGAVHALALHVYTPAEWVARGQPAPDSPDCQVGSKRN